MKRKSLAAAVLVLALVAGATAWPDAAGAQESPGETPMMGPGSGQGGPMMGQGYGQGGPMMGQGYGRGGYMMGPGYGQGAPMMYGPTPTHRGHGWHSDCHMAGGMMGHAPHMAPGMMGYGWQGGPPMMAPGMMGHGMMGHGMAQPIPRDLTVPRVRRLLEHHIEQLGKSRLAVGEVTEQDEDVIVAEIVTQDGSLLQRLEFDRYFGWVRPIE